MTIIEHLKGFIGRMKAVPCFDYQADFALSMPDSQMAPLIEAGDYVLFRKADTFEPEQIALFSTESGFSIGHAWPQDDGTIILQPENPEFRPLTTTPERLLGVPVALFRPF